MMPTLARWWLLWFGVVGGVLAWIIHLGASYALVPWVCATGNEWILHALTGLLGLVALAATGSGVRTWRRARRPTSAAPDDSEAELGGPEGSGWVEGFLGSFGAFLSAFFLVLILVEGLPALLHASPCDTVPTLDRPIVHLDDNWTVAGVPALSSLRTEGLVAPGSIWTSWNPDPWILAIILILSGTYVTGVRRLWRRAGRGRGLRRWRVAAYLSGMWILVLALISPMDAMGETLFSVHMVQHMLLMVVAAPLLILGQPIIAFLWALTPARRRKLSSWSLRATPLRRGWGFVSHPITVLLLHVGALWVWHIPTLYQAALQNRWLHSLEHASYLLSAMLFWWVLTRGARLGRWPGYGAGMLYVFGAALQSGALGALLLFARAPWYPAHAAGADLWGLDLLVDQQLAGALMWVPAGLVYTAAILLLFVAWLRKADRTVAHRERHGWGVDARRPA
jgi:putative membrane protein